MHLIEKAKQGLVLPNALPPELHPSASSAGPQAGAGAGERTRKLSEGSTVTFEDRRKENFELGRMELERRRRARQEQIEKEAVSASGRQSPLTDYVVLFSCLCPTVPVSASGRQSLLTV